MEITEINKSNVEEFINNHENYKLDESFLLDFLKFKKHLILNSGEKIIYATDKGKKLTISCKYLFPGDISIIKSYFKDKFMISTGILGDRDFIRINILN